MPKRSNIKRDPTVRTRARSRFKREQLPCYLCGQAIDYSRPWSAQDPECMEADHVIPLELGGADTVENQRPAHRGCNSKKRAKLHAPIIKRSGALKR